MTQINNARTTIYENGYQAGSEKFQYNCIYCNEPIPLGEKSWDAAKAFLRRKEEMGSQPMYRLIGLVLNIELLAVHPCPQPLCMFDQGHVISI